MSQYMSPSLRQADDLIGRRGMFLVSCRSSVIDTASAFGFASGGGHANASASFPFGDSCELLNYGTAVTERK